MNTLESRITALLEQHQTWVSPTFGPEEECTCGDSLAKVSIAAHQAEMIAAFMVQVWKGSV